MTFSFGYIATPQSGVGWITEVRRAEELGYTSVLLPDTLFTTSPIPALAAAAAVTTTIKLRPWVLAAPMRHPAATARECSALQLLSGGRFELGIGAGRPDAASEADKLGMPWGSATVRREQVAETVRVVRESVDPAPPVIVAASGPKALAAAAGFADRIGLAAQPQASEADLMPMIETLHAVRAVPISYQVAGVGAQLQFWVAKKSGMSADDFHGAGAVAVLDADPSKAADEIRERKERLGIDELLVPADLAEAFAPILERLRRR
ncbi:LLM class flavin-dependent oxidoreductase [Antrihabitans cavernicola]|uniref:LLM class flavin-dependent oxidoreductase n=1 Tax=Antrihabitans cavernicola TaxID=2495913 RepID=A0A5A7SD15_9NOCA|nr:LLM class flavin-dependent oxidoreductase [Spelaeibacter cavernicola]KAA0022101.1 LLM class flavin-dependent oxidoreductase [Spelaeibacter cavernicola]